MWGVLVLTRVRTRGRQRRAVRRDREQQAVSEPAGATESLTMAWWQRKGNTVCVSLSRKVGRERAPQGEGGESR